MFLFVFFIFFVQIQLGALLLEKLNKLPFFWCHFLVFNVLMCSGNF